jgi:HupE/UreJ protein
MKGLWLAAAFAVFPSVFWATASVAEAHDIPADVTIQAFLKPEGQRLRLLVRVPLEALRDLNVPSRRPGTSVNSASGASSAGAGSLIDLARLQPLLSGAATVWVVQNIDLYENDTPLPGTSLLHLQVSLPTDRSFGSYEDALRHVSGPALPDATDVSWTTGVLDMLLETPITSSHSQFSIRPRLARLGVRTVTVLRFVTPEGSVRAFEYSGDPGVVRLDPRWHQAALGFIRLGFFHILDGTDHLLFLFCLVIPFRRFRALVPIVTAFTVAHSVTLIGSAYDLAPTALWFPPLIETLIAVSIVYMALENIATPHPSRRWLITLGFGLVHGFGFSFALRESLQFAGSHLLTSLLSFNVGVELGQLVVLAILVPALELLFRYVVAERMGAIILSALVAHTGWHWMTERFDRLRQYRFEWPAIDAVFLLALTRWLIIAVAAAGAVWLVTTLARQYARNTSRSIRL